MLRSPNRSICWPTDGLDDLASFRFSLALRCKKVRVSKNATALPTSIFKAVENAVRPINRGAITAKAKKPGKGLQPRGRFERSSHEFVTLYPKSSSAKNIAAPNANAMTNHRFARVACSAASNDLRCSCPLGCARARLYSNDEKANDTANTASPAGANPSRRIGASLDKSTAFAMK